MNVTGFANTCWTTDKQEMDERGQYREGTETVTAHENYFETKYYLVGSSSGKILLRSYSVYRNDPLTIHSFLAQARRSRCKAESTSFRSNVLYPRIYRAVSSPISDTFGTSSRRRWTALGNSIKTWRVPSRWYNRSTLIKNRGLRCVCFFLSCLGTLITRCLKRPLLLIAWATAVELFSLILYDSSFPEIFVTSSGYSWRKD